MNIIGRGKNIKKENIEDRSRSMFSGGEKTLSLLLSAAGGFELYTYWQNFACSNNIKIISARGRIFIGKIFEKVCGMLATGKTAGADPCVCPLLWDVVSEGYEWILMM